MSANQRAMWVRIPHEPTFLNKTGTMAMEYLGEVINAFRQLENMNQKELAAIVDANPATIAKIEKGGTNVSFELIEKIAKALHQPLSRLIRIAETWEE